MKYEIMLGILFDLLGKKCVSAKFLSEKYDVSIRSIYRYISCIESAGVPIYTIRGAFGGFSIMDTFKLPSTFLTVSEYNQTINALSAINNEIPDKSLGKVIDKLKATVKNEFSGFDIKSGNLIIDAGPWGDTVGYKTKLKILHQCIEENLALSIVYHDRNGQVSKREIEPHVILFKQGIWYVYAFCRLRNTFRFFKTGRIENAVILKEKFNRRKINPEDLPLDFWHNNVLTENVILEIDKACVSDIEEWLGVENVKEKNDKFVADVNLPIDNGLIMKIMSYGKNVKVVSPENLKTLIKEQAKSIFNAYC